MHTRFMLLFIGFALAPFAWPAPRQIDIIPGSSTRGAQLFQQKACIQCHSFNGAGGSTAPDLARKDEHLNTPVQLAAALWNHGPRMWQAQRSLQVRPVLDSVETSDLFAYFYSLAYSKFPGNAAKGAHLFQEKGCSGCHDVEPGTQHRGRKPSGPPLSTWRAVADPLEWAEIMWNHSEKVYIELANVRPGWPRFSADEMGDLLAYLRSVPEARSQSATFQPGDPQSGRLTFESRCEACHSFGSRTAGPKIDLLKRPASPVLMGYAAAMWNHAPEMHLRAGSDFPVLAPGDMSNLVAYLFAKRYFDEPGNAARGAALFQTKNCTVCHEQLRRETGAPDLALATETYSPITISAALWRHGPEMFELMDRKKIAWPEFSGTEMSDLLSFLNSRLVSRIAR